MILVSDSHVSVANGNVEPFFKMLARLGQTKQDLVFLGDIFDLWIALPRYQERIQTKFLEWCAMNRADRSIGFVEGNHEFYVAEESGHCFSWCTADSWVDEQANVMLVHGDQINRADKKYLRFRRLTKNGLVKNFARAVPFGPSLANVLKKRLKKTNRAFRIGLPRKSVDAFAEAMFSTGVRRVFVGHFHQEYRYRSGNRQALHVLPDWFATQMVSVYDPQKETLESLHWEKLR